MCNNVPSAQIFFHFSAKTTNMAHPECRYSNNLTPMKEVLNVSIFDPKSSEPPFRCSISQYLPDLSAVYITFSHRGRFWGRSLDFEDDDEAWVNLPLVADQEGLREPVRCEIKQSMRGFKVSSLHFRCFESSAVSYLSCYESPGSHIKNWNSLRRCWCISFNCWQLVGWEILIWQGRLSDYLEQMLRPCVVMIMLIFIFSYRYVPKYCTIYIYTSFTKLLSVWLFDPPLPAEGLEECTRVTHALDVKCSNRHFLCIDFPSS